MTDDANVIASALAEADWPMGHPDVRLDRCRWCQEERLTRPAVELPVAPDLRAGHDPTAVVWHREGPCCKPCHDRLEAHR